MKKVKIAGLAAAVLLAITPATGTTYAAETGTQDSGFDVTKLTDAFNQFTGFFKDAFSKIQGVFDKDAKDDEPTTQEGIATQQVNKLGNVVYTDNDTAGKLHANLNTLVQWQGPLESNQFARTLFNGYGELPALNIINEDTYNIIKAGEKYDYTFSYPYSTDNDVNDAFDNFLNGKGAQVKVTINSIDEATKKVVNTKELVFINNTDTATSTDNLNIKFNTPIKVAVGSDTLPIKESESGKANTTIDNTKGMVVTPKEVDPQGFYETKTDAAKRTNPLDLGSKFTEKGKTYYQPVEITFDTNKVNLTKIADNANTNESAVFNLNGQRVLTDQIKPDTDGINSVTYVREIVVGDKDATTPDTDNPDTDKPDTDKPDTNKPDTDKPDPEEEVGVWKETNQDGIITTNNQIANLYNDDNVLTTRSLADNTQWVTDKSRVNSATGQKQYRVSTHEWVNASDVSYQDKVDKFFTSVTQYPEFHTVNLAGPSGFVYALYNQDGIRSLRGLAGRTSWATDQRATDADGNIYYRVSTDEWVQQGVGVDVN